MRHIFVSYCHEDADFAQILEEKIREAGFSTRRDLHFSAGDDWRAEIDDGIKDAVAVVVIMSPSARMSPYVNYEWAFASGSGVPVLPVLLKLPLSDLHPRLSIVQSLDFSNYLNRPWEKLAESLRDVADAEREFTLRVPRDAPPVVRNAGHALDSMDGSQRLAAIATLAQTNHPAAIEVLADALRHPVEEVRFGAAFQLAEKYQDPRALPVLFEAMRHRNERFKLWMITKIGEPAVPALLEALEDSTFERRSDAFSILGYIGGSRAVEALIGYLRRPGLETRKHAAYALAETKDSSALPALHEAMHDVADDVRQAAAVALGKCGGVIAVPALMELLRDAHRDVRHRAVCSLEDICAIRPLPASLEPLVPPLIDALLTALEDEYDQVRAFASRALEKLADPRAIPGLMAALRPKGAHRGPVLRALKPLREAALPALRNALNDPDEHVRITAFELIAECGQDADAPRLAETLRDQSADVRFAAIRAIGQQSRVPTVVMEALIERLNDPEEDVRIEAIDAMGDIRNPSAVPHLVACLKVEALAPSAVRVLDWFNTREARSAVKAWKRSAGE